MVDRCVWNCLQSSRPEKSWQICCIEKVSLLRLDSLARANCASRMLAEALNSHYFPCALLLLHRIDEDCHLHVSHLIQMCLYVPAI